MRFLQDPHEHRIESRRGTRSIGYSNPSANTKGTCVLYCGVMKISGFKDFTTWICLLSFCMHVVLHIGPALPWSKGHTGHGVGHHSTMVSSNASHSYVEQSEFDDVFHLSEHLESNRQHDHTPSDHKPEPSDHDPSHHLKIQHRVSNQTSSIPFTHVVRPQFYLGIATHAQPRVVWTDRCVIVDFIEYRKSVRLIV